MANGEPMTTDEAKAVLAEWPEQGPSFIDLDDKSRREALSAMIAEVERLTAPLGADDGRELVTPGDLLPCPFCGGDAERVDIPEASSENDLAGNPNAGGSFIRCVSCDACTTLEFGRKESLEGRWNDRFRSGVPALAASLRDAVAEIERLREALAFYADMTGDGYDVMVTSYGLSTELGCIIKDGGDKARALLGDTHE